MITVPNTGTVSLSTNKITNMANELRAAGVSPDKIKHAIASAQQKRQRGTKRKFL